MSEKNIKKIDIITDEDSENTSTDSTYNKKGKYMSLEKGTELLDVVVQLKKQLINENKEHVSRQAKQFKLLETSIKEYNKLVTREFNKLDKKAHRKKKKSITGLEKEHQVTDNMQDFLTKNFDIPRGTPVSRTQLTSLLNIYIKDNNLKNDVIPKQIKFDNGLNNLFENHKDEIHTYPDITRYINEHFPKTKPSTNEN